MEIGVGERVERRLAAIVAADVAGYSRLMGGDELATLTALKAHRRELVDPAVAEHHGRIVKSTGDGLLVEFASVVDAVTCAVEVQRGMISRNAGTAEGRRIVFRVGVNLGDIIIDDDDIFGDGVNVAARLEAICEPGGICISRAARDQVRDKLDLPLADLGEHSVKNIARPVRVFALEPSVIAHLPKASPASRTIFDGGGAAASRPTRRALPLSEKPSIAVLPFANMSGDPEQEYFADGMTEDIITALSKWRWFLVLARNSTFTFKGKAVSIRQIGQELGARYILEGSVRRAGARIRIVAQLIEAATDRHIWADRYDHGIEDIFAVQDEITQRVVAALDPAIRVSELDRIMRKPPGNMDAWDHFLRGSYHSYFFRRPDVLLALDHLRHAIAIDGGFAAAHARLALTLTFAASNGQTLDRRESLAEALKSAKTGVKLDEFDASAHTALSYALTFSRRHDAALEAAHRAIELNVNFHFAYFALGLAQLFAGAPDEALLAFDAAARLSPRDPGAWALHGMRALAHYVAKQYEAASDCVDKALAERPGYGGGQIIKAAALVRLARMQEATAVLADVPGRSLAELRLFCPFRRPADFEHLLSALQEAKWKPSLDECAL